MHYAAYSGQFSCVRLAVAGQLSGWPMGPGRFYCSTCAASSRYKLHDQGVSSALVAMRRGQLPVTASVVVVCTLAIRHHFLMEYTLRLRIHRKTWRILHGKVYSAGSQEHTANPHIRCTGCRRA